MRADLLGIDRLLQSERTLQGPVHAFLDMPGIVLALRLKAFLSADGKHVLLD